jgi:CheY-like chemotaxis protein
VKLSENKDLPKGRILVVDDRADWRKTLSGILLDEGYDVRVAESRQEALHLVNTERFHLAVLDVRLDETDETNREGLELMRQIKAQDPTILVIILTGYADVDMVQEALRPQQTGLSLAYSFVEKPNTHELIEFVRRAFEGEVKINWNLVIEAEGDLLQQIPARLRFAHQPKPPTNQLKVEIDELLRKLFFNCESVTLRPLEHGFSRAMVFQVEPRYQQRGRGESMVAKIGEWPLIRQEERNFAQVVQGVVGGHRLPQRLELTRTRSLGGLVYSYAGLGEASGFAEFYAGAMPDQIISVLENLFLETCFPWGRRNPVVRPAFNFAEYYFSHLHLSPAELRHDLTSLFDKQAYLSRRGHSNSELWFLENTSLVNPVEFVIRHPLIGDTTLTLVHGDLTGYNVILDRHHETWLIDFAKTGQGLLLQDFASFEIFVKFSLLRSNDPRSFYNWEKELVDGPALQPSARLLNLIPPDSLAKAHQVILAIRRLAYQVSGDDYWPEYLINLLFHALKLITIMPFKPEQRALALVSAALICQRLMADVRAGGVG